MSFDIETGSGIGFDIVIGESERIGAYARMMAALLPPGRVWRLIGGGLLPRLFLACADELDRLDQRTADLLAESVPLTASELIPEYERELDIAAMGTLEERQARIVARLVARQRFRPVDFQTALAPLLGQSAEDVVIIERTHAQAVAMGDDREIFRFFVYRDPSTPGTYYLDSAQALVDKIKPSHTIGHVIESVHFTCGDPHSICGRDILGP